MGPVCGLGTLQEPRRERRRAEARARAESERSAAASERSAAASGGALPLLLLLLLPQVLARAGIRNRAGLASEGTQAALARLGAWQEPMVILPHECGRRACAGPGVFPGCGASGEYARASRLISRVKSP